MRNTPRLRARPLVVLALCLTMASCSPIVRRHGFVPTQDDLAQILPGRDTRETVLELLPPPTAGGVVEGGNLYYVFSEFHTVGPFEPREVNREVLALTFNDSDILTGVERYGLQDGIVVPLSRRVTDDNVADTTFIRQLLGNLGRFDPSGVFGEG